MFFPGPSIICTRIYSGDIRPANEPSKLGAQLGLLGVNRDRAPIFRSQPNRAESEKTYDFRDRAETSNQLSEPRPSSGNSFSACLSSARKSRKSVCITQSARSIVIGNHICVLQHAFKRSENSRQVVSPGAMAGTVTVTVTVTVVTCHCVGHCHGHTVDESPSL